ncbi:gamma-glutamylcyclotransferase 2-3 isoform X2 [Ananas comosus]|uniref:glutathione-specific gamma-glutamylcyclotransferase n=1 Tax=Ananas comosus TaxID=4615 RepID=A0A6P5GRV7_ANACO|nr:gamma-glutamylcyclotransferase 2-3 isoform X2 [Ananas comosus]
MAMWVFGYGSLIWKPGFPYDEKLLGFIRGYRRVFYQGSTDHRGTPAFPGRTVTLEPLRGEVCWGVAYKVSKEEDKKIALEHLEVREKQYDKTLHLDFFTIFSFSRHEDQYELPWTCSSRRYSQANCPSCRPVRTKQRLPFPPRRCIKHIRMRRCACQRSCKCCEKNTFSGINMLEEPFKSR